MPAEQTSAALVDELPPYILSSEVEDVAAGVIAANDAFRELGDIRLAFALRTDQPWSDDDEIDDVVHAVKASALWACLGDYDAVVWAKADYWKLIGDTQRRALLTHALSHVFINDKGRVVLVGHDVEAFERETSQFGAWTSRLAHFWRSLGRDPDTGQELAKGEALTPTKRPRNGSSDAPVVHP